MIKTLAALLLLALPAAATAQGQDGGASDEAVIQDEERTGPKDTEEQFQLGLKALRGDGQAEDDDAALRWFQRAADQKHPAATYYVGYLHAYGKGVEADRDAALGWWFRAADLGYPSAEREVGYHYRYADAEGKVKPDYARALTWYRKAAEQGDEQAMGALAGMYRDGEGLSAPDYKQAFSWDLKAAAKGLVPSCTELGIAYEKGQGVDADPVKAYAFYLRGKRGYDDRAKEPLERLITQLSEKQVATAEQLAKDPIEAR